MHRAPGNVKSHFWVTALCAAGALTVPRAQVCSRSPKAIWKQGRALLEAKNWAWSRIRQIYIFNLSGLLACSGQPLPETLGLAWTRSHSQFRFSAVPLKDMETRVEEIVGFGLSRQWEERLWPRNQKDLKALLFSFLLDVPRWSTLWPRPKLQACSQETRTLPCL